MSNSILGAIVEEAVRLALQQAEQEPPEYIPAKPERHAVTRIPNLCPDDTHSAHDPETCRDPACYCYPF